MPRKQKTDDGQAAPAIDQRELEAYRASLPAYRQHETFRFITLQWDVVKASYLIERYPRAVGQLQVIPAARAYGLDERIYTETRPDGTVIQHGNGIVSINPVYAMSEQIDQQRPVLLALVELPERARPTPLLIDGLHRLYRAAQEQLEHIPCYALTPAEEQLCRL